MTLAVEPLVRLAQELDVPMKSLVGVERVERLAGTFEVSSRAVSALSVDVVSAFASAYPDAARLSIGTGDLDEFTVEEGRFDERTLQRLVAEAGQVQVTYRAVITVDKTLLAARLVDAARDVVVRLFFFGESLGAHLERGPSEIERVLWRDPGKRLLLIVLQTPITVSGTCLSIVSGDREAISAECAKPIPDGLDRIALRRNDYVGWDSALSTKLTPLHFEMPPVENPLFGERLDSLAVGLAAMYLCDRARRIDRPDGRSFTQAEFRGREHVAFIPIDWAAAKLAGVTATHLDAVLGVVAWCYEPVPEHRGTDMLADRLPLVQTRIAQLLESRPEKDRMTVFALVMPSIAEGVEWYWRSFIEGRVSEYLDHVRELEGAIGQTVGRLAEQTAALVKRLTETSLAAVAALIGSFIAATFKDPFEADLFRIGMLSYAAYVLLFPLGVGLTSSIGDARLTFSGFEAQLGPLAQVLGKDRVSEIAADRPRRARERFRFWVCIVGILYGVAIVAAAVAALAVPGVIEHKGADSTTTTTTTTLAPPRTPTTG